MSTTSKKVLEALTGTSSSIKSLTTSIISTAISSAEDPSTTTTVLGQMATSIVGSIPPTGSQSPTSCADSPNEYRNLLTSLSGQKSDHVLWIESLKQYHWEGDPEHFSFALDKCGVPTLKEIFIKLQFHKTRRELFMLEKRT